MCWIRGSIIGAALPDRQLSEALAHLLKDARLLLGTLLTYLWLGLLLVDLLRLLVKVLLGGAVRVSFFFDWIVPYKLLCLLRHRLLVSGGAVGVGARIHGAVGLV